MAQAIKTKVGTDVLHGSRSHARKMWSNSRLLVKCAWDCMSIGLHVSRYISVNDNVMTTCLLQHFYQGNQCLS